VVPELERIKREEDRDQADDHDPRMWLSFLLRFVLVLCHFRSRFVLVDDLIGVFRKAYLTDAELTRETRSRIACRREVSMAIRASFHKFLFRHTDSSHQIFVSRVGFIRDAPTDFANSLYSGRASFHLLSGQSHSLHDVLKSQIIAYRFELVFVKYFHQRRTLDGEVFFKPLEDLVLIVEPDIDGRDPYSIALAGPTSPRRRRVLRRSFRHRCPCLCSGKPSSAG
jgi:hypothetical protein